MFAVLYFIYLFDRKKCSQVATLIRTLNSLVNSKYDFEKKDLFNFLFCVRGLSQEELTNLSKRLKEGETITENLIPSRSSISNESFTKASILNFDYLKKRLEIQVKFFFYFFLFLKNLKNLKQKKKKIIFFFCRLPNQLDTQCKASSTIWLL